MERILPVLLLAAACSTPKGLEPPDHAEIHAFQNAVRRETARAEDELFVERRLLELPAGQELETLDVHGRTGNGRGDVDGDFATFVLCVDGDTLTHVPWESSIPVPRATDRRYTRYYGENAGGEFFACAGRALTGFTRIHRIALDCGGVGAVLVAEKGGTQVLAVGDDVREGDFFDARFPPVLSDDGSRIAYVTSSLFQSHGVIAPTKAPLDAMRIEQPGKLDWPIELNHDGSRWSAKGHDGEHAIVVESGEVLGRFDEVDGPVPFAKGDVVAYRVKRDGKRHYLVGRTLGPAFDEVSGLTVSEDGGRWAYVGRDAKGSHVVVDGVVTATAPDIRRLALADRGNAWAAVLRGADGDRVRIGDRQLGPFPRIEWDLELSADGSTVAFWSEDRRWFVDGAPVGAGFEQVSDVQPIDGGGYAFEGRAADGLYLVTPAARSGPWDWLGTRRVAADGRRIAFAAGRGREVWRKVIQVR